MRLVRFAALGSASLAMACGGPTVGDIIQNEVVLSVAATTTKPDVVALGETRGGLAVTRAFVSASAVGLLPCARGTAPITLDPRGYDLLSMPPQSEVVTTSVTKLCGLLVDIDPVSSNAAPDVPKGSALYIEGQDPDGVDFTLQSDRSMSFLFEAAEGESFGDLPLLLGFDVSTWLAGLPLPEEMADMQADLFVSQLRDSAALFVDRNGNQALDDDEQTPVARASAPR